MNQDQYRMLATQFATQAIDVKDGDQVWLEYCGETTRPMADACESIIREMGGVPYVLDGGSEAVKRIMDDVNGSSDPESIKKQMSAERLSKMQEMQGYIRIADIADNQRCDISTTDTLAFRSEIMKEATDHRVRKTKWLVTQAPNAEFASACGMDTVEFDQFYFDACMADYARMTEAVKPLTELLATGDHVRLTGEGTDIEFSIKDIGAVPCTGTLNIPDGEAFTAPVKNSVNGRIRYVQSRYMGIDVPWVEFEVYEGRIERAVTEGESLTAKLNEILDKDAGARYFGEFAIGFNPHIQHPVGSILFDEKIDGSFHLTPGQCYTDWANNGNHSAVHWDLVHIQREDYGGGDIIIDDELIRRNGVFIPKRLQALNPENLHD